MDTEKTSRTISLKWILSLSVLICVIILTAFTLIIYSQGAFRIPANSMMPTLMRGDYILVNIFSYGVKIPFSDTRVDVGNEPQRGDVIVFRYPEDESLDYIKRIIGLPGDHIKYYNRRLTVNGRPMSIAF